MLVDYVCSFYYLKLKLIYYNLFQNMGFRCLREKKKKEKKKKIKKIKKKKKKKEKKKDKSNGENVLVLQCGKLRKQSIAEMNLHLVVREDCR